MNHDDAKDLVDGLRPALEPIDSLFVRMVAFHETNYGGGWKGAGAGSNNWGAITFAPKGEAAGACPGGFAHEDSLFDPKLGAVRKYTTCFRAYPTPAAGAADVVRVALKPNVREALRTGRVDAGAAAMFANKYFLGTKPTADENIADYTAALERAKAKILAETGEPDPFVDGGEAGSAPSSPGPVFSPSSAVSLPRLQLGSAGMAVELWRELVTHDSPALASVRRSLRPAFFDERLAGATRYFQEMHELDVDGVVGSKQTWPQMIQVLRGRH